MRLVFMKDGQYFLLFLVYARAKILPISINTYSFYP